MSAGDIGNHPGAANAVVADSGSKRSYPKTHVNFWKARLEHRTYTRDGKAFEVAEWSVRVHFKGIRKSFDLDTANKEEAAAKARDIYLSLLAKGWSTTINELAPQAAQPAETSSDSSTIGEFLAEVKRTAHLKPKTLRLYTQSLRQLAAFIHGVKSDASRYDYRNGGLMAWRRQIDVIPLSSDHAFLAPALEEFLIAKLDPAHNLKRR